MVISHNTYSGALTLIPGDAMTHYREVTQIDLPSRMCVHLRSETTAVRQQKHRHPYFLSPSLHRKDFLPKTSRSDDTQTHIAVKTVEGWEGEQEQEFGPSSGGYPPPVFYRCELSLDGSPFFNYFNCFNYT